MPPEKMNITEITEPPAILSSKALKPPAISDLSTKSNSLEPTRRKTRTPSFTAAGVRLKKGGAAAVKRSRPETPLPRWKLDDGDKYVAVKEEKLPRKFSRRREVMVSARKLAGGLWRLQPPPGVRSGGVDRHCQPKIDLSGFQIAPSFQFSNCPMEAATKWDPVGLKTSVKAERIYGYSEPLVEQIGSVSVISTLKMELEQSRACIHELETERRSSKKKLELFLRKLSEERATWKTREHKKIRAITDDIQADLKRERKNCQRMEIVISKLGSELAGAKLATKHFMLECGKERKATELMEDICKELVNEVGEDKAEAEALKTECMNIQEEVEEERKMFQMAEVWREERVQMKLTDAKVTLEEKYSQMNKLIADMETFLSSISAIPDMEEMRKAEFLLQAAASVNIQDVREFIYDPPNPDGIFSIFENVNFCENNNDGEIETCGAFSPASHVSEIPTVSPEVNMVNKNRVRIHSHGRRRWEWVQNSKPS